MAALFSQLAKAISRSRPDEAATNPSSEEVDLLTIGMEDEPPSISKALQKANLDLERGMQVEGPESYSGGTLSKAREFT